ncbi:MAG: chemotaxis-specific protein-glutamate methyltransferase CheB [Deltaproteobacteria bacterium]|nr:chemotaxis-specific protein-glutamate methyltransferase CheB [Deltaproteobacteria bacterium]MBN2672823.1 chemotaxis-specific protein-glutamate methyltransferase CheB [Deltaproteobacteria bacterium]
MTDKKIRLLIIDDSAYNRKAISEFFINHPNVEIVGKAADGQEGLQMALNLNPSVITLDLEMPRLDGFGFLRLLMSGQPTPVIVISSHGEKENVFRALELGALDFVAKPSVMISPAIYNIKDDVVQKVLAAGKFNLEALSTLSRGAPATGMTALPSEPPKELIGIKDAPATNVVALGASTGGPASITKVLCGLPEHLDAAIVIAQHMPAQFTASFAKRLDRLTPMRVVEMQASEVLRNGSVYITPGDGDLMFSKVAEGYMVKKVSLSDKCRYAPCIDRMFVSAAQTVGEKLLGVILTGMGDDGTRGCAEIYNAGGTLLVESEETAIVYGMPKAVVEAGIPAKVRPLHMIAAVISTFGRPHH